MEQQETTHALGEPTSGESEVQPGDDGGTIAEAAAAPPNRPPRPPTIGQLRRDRRRLWDERQETVYHLGGLAAYLDGLGMIDQELVSGRAAIVHELDARIARIDDALVEVDRRGRRGRMPKPEGYCLSCGAPFLPDAMFCSQCGSRVHVADRGATDESEPEYEADTGVIPPVRGGEGL